LVGERFGRLLVLAWAGMRKGKNSSQGYSYWKCKCDCGIIRDFRESNIIRGLSQSCGCGNTDSKTTHGLSGTAFWKFWTHLKHIKRLPEEWWNFVQFADDTFESYPFGDRSATGYQRVYLIQKDDSKPLGPKNFKWTINPPVGLKTNRSRYVYTINGKVYSRRDISAILDISRERCRQLHNAGTLEERLIKVLYPQLGT